MLPNNSPKNICVKSNSNSIGQAYGWMDSSGVVQKSEEEKRGEEKRERCSSYLQQQEWQGVIRRIETRWDGLAM